MRGFTVYQPWANFIIFGEKKIETRPRKTNIRGTVFIHAGKRFVEAGLNPILISTNAPYELGAIIGTVDIVDCVRVEEVRHEISDIELALGDYTDGRYGWVLENPIKFDTPISIRGQQGWWQWNDENI